MERVDPLVVGLLLVVAVLVVSQIIEATFGEGGAAPSVDGAAPRFRRRLGGLWRRATPDRVVETDGPLAGNRTDFVRVGGGPVRWLRHRGRLWERL